MTVFEFVETAAGKFAWAKPVYMNTYPIIIDAGGTERTYDGIPGVIIPHVENYGADLMPLDVEPVEYPVGFGGTTIVSDNLGNAGVIDYSDVDLDWKVPLRPHLGIVAVMPGSSDNYLFGKSDDTIAGTNTTPPRRPSVATPATGASTKARPCTTRSKSRTPCSCSATPTPRRATRSSLVRPWRRRSLPSCASLCTRHPRTCRAWSRRSTPPARDGGLVHRARFRLPGLPH